MQTTDAAAFALVRQVQVNVLKGRARDNKEKPREKLMQVRVNLRTGAGDQGANLGSLEKHPTHTSHFANPPPYAINWLPMQHPLTIVDAERNQHITNINSLPGSPVRRGSPVISCGGKSARLRESQIAKMDARSVISGRNH